MRLIITGYARHGKDTTSEILAEMFGLKFVSSSYFVAEKAARPYLAEYGFIYKTLEDCYTDRANHRGKWFDAIREYNTPDKARMGKELFAQYDIYCGLRNIDELSAMRFQGVFDYAIWVDRSLHMPPEHPSSMSIRKEDCDFVLDNNRSLSDLETRATQLYKRLYALHQAQNCFGDRKPLRQVTG